MSSGFSNALKYRWSLNLAPVSLSNKKVNFYTCPRLTSLNTNATDNESFLDWRRLSRLKTALTTSSIKTVNKTDALNVRRL